MAGGPVEIDVEYTRGDSVPIAFVLTDDTGTAVDITSWSFVMTVDPDSEPPDNTTLVMQVSGTITDAVNGAFEFAPTTVESDFEPDQYYYDIQATDAGGDKDTIVKGKFTLLQDITKT